MPIKTHTLLKSLLLVCLALVTACSTIPRNPVPEEVHLDVSILGRQDLRFWGDHEQMGEHPAMNASNPDMLEQHFGGIMHREHNYLAISGGGANGAYGAGVLVGWSKLGTRPQFTMVTGVSTGALAAPFAFLGSDYDQQLKTLYTSLDSSGIFFRRSIFAILRGDSVADNTPLSEMLDQHINDQLIKAIAHEYNRGRSLRIATTNLDAGRAVIWNIGRIANTGHPEAGQLIRQILLASAAIPGIFPPSYIQVQGPDGRTYDEMHVDGGTSAQMFLYPSNTDWAEVMKVFDVKGTPTAYLIRNSRINPDFTPVRARVRDIAGRSVASLIRTQGIGDIYRIAAITSRDGVAVELTAIPPDAPRDPGNELFDPDYMSALFDFGYQRTINNAAWQTIDIIQLTSEREP